MYTTQISKEGRKLRIPVIIADGDAQRRHLKHSIPGAGAMRGEKCAYQSVENAPISALFPERLLKSLMVVKIDRGVQEKAPNLLNDISQKGDTRTHLFSSGGTHYFGSPELKSEIAKFFRSEPDAAVRYGSLFTSNCFQGLERLGPQNQVSPEDDAAIKLKVVSYKRPEDQKFETDDCFGVCSSDLAEKLGAPQNKPFQFRLMWDENWVDPSKDQPFLPSFLSKGVLKVDDELVEDPNQIILDQSSIKGINKGVLDKFVPRGDYELDEAVIGNRENAESKLYRNSWQFTSAFSAKAVEADFGPKTQLQAEDLKQIQSDDVFLKAHMLELHEYSKLVAGGCDDQYVDTDIDESPQKDEEDPKMIQILKHDQMGILNNAPKVQDFYKSRLQRGWRELAVNGGHKHQSSRAAPSRELERGQVCIPGVADGEVVIVTRSPIPSKDNIRKYINNAKLKKLSQYKGCIWMRSEDAADFHQGDFDGDQMQWDLARNLPNIAKEVKWAGEPGDFKAMAQRPKKPYVVADISIYTDDRETLKQFAPVLSGSVLDGAVRGEDNKVGLVANMIGKIQSAEPTAEDRLTHDSCQAFHKEKHHLLERLMGALQIEVDYGKSAERLEDVEEIGGATLLKEAKKWTEAHPVPFFKHMKDDDIYKHFMMPDSGAKACAVDVLSRITNQAWEAVPEARVSRRKFRNVLHSDQELEAAASHPLYPQIEASAKEYKDKFDALIGQNARDQKNRAIDRKQAIQRIGQFHQDCEAYLNDGLGIEGATTADIPEIRALFSVAIWQACHTPDSDVSAEAFKCGGELYDWCNSQPVTFGTMSIQTSRKAGESEADVVSAPFGEKTDEVKDRLDKRGIKYTAYQQRSAPMMDFVLDPSTSKKDIELLENSYPDHGKVNFQGKVLRPPSYSKWSIQRKHPGTGSLAYNVCMPELLTAIDRQQHMKEGVKIVGLQHNGLGKQRTGTVPGGAILRVGRYPNDFHHKGLAGQPCFESGGRIIGAGVDGQKMPIVGTVFRSPDLMLIANKNGVTSSAEGSIQQNSIYVPIVSSEETVGPVGKNKTAATLAVNEATAANQESRQPRSVKRTKFHPPKPEHSKPQAQTQKARPKEKARARQAQTQR